MSGTDFEKDLVVLAADKNMESSMKGILTRPEALKINPIAFDIYSHPNRDPGCLREGHDFLRPFVNKYRRALVMLDREGCGREEEDREAIESALEQRLRQSGWGNRAAAIVIDPELENWVWSDSPEVDFILGWEGKSPALRAWLETEGFLASGWQKPSPPKAAVDEALRRVRLPRSSSLYLQLAKKVSFRRCQDPAFLKLKEKLTQWFAPPPTGRVGIRAGRG